MAITSNNVQNVRFLRNGSLFQTHELAKEALEGKIQGLSNDQDGSVILARYQENGEDVKTLAGFIYATDAAKSITIFDVDASGADVDGKIAALRDEINNKLGNGITSANTATAQLSALSGSSSDTSGVTSVWGAKAYADDLISTLDYTDTAVTGSYVSAVNEADGKISVSRVALPTVAEISVSGKPITAVAEDKGTISATAGTIDAQYVNIEDTGSIIEATTVEGALAEIATEIDAMDLAVVSGDGEVITAVSESDGKVSASKTAIKDVKLTGYVKDTSATGDIAATDDIEDALSKLENKAAAATVANADASINVTSGSSGTDINVNIKSGEKVLAKDGSAGLYTDIKLSAVTPSSTTVKEEYSLIGTNGTALGTNIKIYKDSALLSVALLHADTTSTPQVLPTYDKATNTWTDIASPTAANQALCYAYEDVSGNTVVAAVPVGSFINEQEFASGITWDATANKVRGVVDQASENFLTVGADGFKLSGVQSAIDTAVSGAVQTLDATVGSQSVASGKHVSVEVVETDGKLTALTVTEENIASVSDLSDEITARKAVDGVDGNAYTADTNAHYISGATSLYGADQALDTALNSLNDDVIKGVKVNGSGLTETNNEVNIQISSAAATGTDASPIVVNTDANGAVTLQILQIDCGEY